MNRKGGRLIVSISHLQVERKGVCTGETHHTQLDSWQGAGYGHAGRDAVVNKLCQNIAYKHGQLVSAARRTVASDQAQGAAEGTGHSDGTWDSGSKWPHTQRSFAGVCSFKVVKLASLDDGVIVGLNVHLDRTLNEPKNVRK